MKKTTLMFAFCIGLAAAQTVPHAEAQQSTQAPITQQGPAIPVSPAPPASAPPASSPMLVPSRPLAIAAHLPELSPWSMFQSADIIVKAVIISLIFASFVTWTLFLAKTLQIFRARMDLVKALARTAEAHSLNEAQMALGATANVLSALLAAALNEIRLSADDPVESSIKERAATRFAEIVRLEARAVRYGMGPIATIGATAPFVGLFGTVWGIMNSFIGISKTQTTNLAVVAPGIAEALLATAVGLAAAIPAVIIYNHFSRSTKGYLDIVGRAAGAAGRLLSRDLDRFNARMMSRAAE